MEMVHYCGAKSKSCSATIPGTRSATIRGTRFKPIQNIKENSLRELKAIPEYKKCMDDWIVRWKKCTVSWSLF